MLAGFSGSRGTRTQTVLYSHEIHNEELSNREPVMLHSSNENRGCFLWLVFAFCSSIILLFHAGRSEASIYHMKGVCSYKDVRYKPGDSFRRGCDKCFCHDFGSYCLGPMKPTSWPRKCRPIRTECGFTVVYRENPLALCRAYSWIG